MRRPRRRRSPIPFKKRTTRLPKSCDGDTPQSGKGKKRGVCKGEEKEGLLQHACEREVLELFQISLRGKGGSTAALSGESNISRNRGDDKSFFGERNGKPVIGLRKAAGGETSRVAFT